jgi:amidohydrolase
MTDLTATKERIAAEVRQLHPRLIEVSHTLHDHPEVAFQEHRACALLTGALEEAGFRVERGVAGLETAFVASYGEGGPAVGILAEYDALPKLGHACGHNLIATWALGAGLALRRALPDLAGTVKVIGTPAEEGGAGKVTMAEAGIFRGLDAALMMHPRDVTYVERGSLALTSFTIEFAGRAAHAAAYPERGLNALDAVLHVFFGVNALRQALPPRTRIHGIITHGGEAVNVIPDYAACKFLLRSTDQATLEGVRERFLGIVRGAELATGCTAQVAEGRSYPHRVSNRALVDLFRDNLVALGLPYEVPPPDVGVGSSDSATVSHLVPMIHPYLQICDPPVGGHTPEFAAAARSARADALLVDGSIALAWTAADVLLRPDAREQLRATFREQLGREPQE